MWSNSSDFRARAPCSFSRAGTSLRSISVTAAMCMTEGNVSLEDWPLLTWSLGWQTDLSPRAPPSSSAARLAMTSLAFMLDCVPDPVWYTTSGKWSSSLPAATSEAASEMARASLGSRSPRRALTRAAAPLSTPKAATTGAGMRSLAPPMSKFWRERWVWAPQSLYLFFVVVGGGKSMEEEEVGVGRKKRRAVSERAKR